MPELPAKPSSVSNCTAKAGGAVSPCQISDTIVEFRPLTNYHGEFGFDWLRVKEDPTPELSYIDGPDTATKGLVLAAYKDGVTEYNATDAQNKMKGTTSSAASPSGEYESFSITRSPTTFRQLTYYVPYLNLYPQGVSATPMTYTPYGGTSTQAPMPPTSALLRMIIDIKGTPPEKIEMEFDTKLFEIKVNNNKINSPYVLPEINYTPTPDDLKTSRSVYNQTSFKLPIIHSAIPLPFGLNITCLKEFASDQRIEVYAYYKKVGTTTTPPELEKN